MTKSNDPIRTLLDVLIQKALLDNGKAAELFMEHEDVESMKKTLLDEKLITPEQLDQALADAKAPVRVSGFEILERVGSGGMGTVYRARQVSMDRIVALKILSSELADDPTFTERFVKEARASAKLNHPNIIQGIDVGEDRGKFYFAMEFIEGVTVKTLINQAGMIPVNESLVILEQILNALEYANSTAGIVHRDIKPDNIMVTTNGDAKLCDLGLAIFEDKSVPVRKRRMAVGTPLYISPEQARGQENVDIRADLYSLGITMHHMLTGKPPFSAEKRQDLLLMHLNETAPAATEPPALVDPVLCRILSMMTAKSPDDRYPTPGKVLEDIQCLRSGSPLKHARNFDAPSSLATPAVTRMTGAQKVIRTRGLTAAQKSVLIVGTLAGGMVLAFIILIVLMLGLSRTAPEPTANNTSPVAHAGLPGAQSPVAPRNASNSPSDNSTATGKPHGAPDARTPGLSATSDGNPGASRVNPHSATGMLERENKLNMLKAMVDNFENQRHDQLLRGADVNTDDIFARLDLFRKAALEQNAPELVKRIETMKTREVEGAKLIEKATLATIQTRELIDDGKYESARALWNELSDSPASMFLPQKTLQTRYTIDKAEREKYQEIADAVSESLRNFDFEKADEILARTGKYEFSQTTLASIARLKQRIDRERRLAKETEILQARKANQTTMRLFWNDVLAFADSRSDTNRINAVITGFERLMSRYKYESIKDWTQKALPILKKTAKIEFAVLDQMIRKHETLPYKNNMKGQVVSNENGKVRIEVKDKGIVIRPTLFIHEIFTAPELIDRYGAMETELKAMYLLARGETKLADKSVSGNRDDAPVTVELLDALNNREGALPGQRKETFSIDVSNQHQTPALPELENVDGDREKAARERIQYIRDYIAQGRLDEAEQALNDLDGPLFTSLARRGSGAAVVARARLELDDARRVRAQSILPALDAADWLDVTGRQWKKISGQWEKNGEYIRGDSRGGEALQVLPSVPVTDFILTVTYRQLRMATDRNGYIGFAVPADTDDIKMKQLFCIGAEIKDDRLLLVDHGTTLTTKNYKLRAGQDYRFQLTVVNGKLTFSVNGEVQITASLKNYTGGLIGLCSQNTVAEFKDIRIKTLQPAPEPAANTAADTAGETTGNIDENAVDNAGGADKASGSGDADLEKNADNPPGARGADAKDDNGASDANGRP